MAAADQPPAPSSNPDDDNALIRRLRLAYSSSALAEVRPAMWSAAIGTATAGAGALLFLMRATVPPIAAASCAAGAGGYAYAYSCFSDGGGGGGGDAGAGAGAAAAARRQEGFHAGIGTSALVASGQLAAFRGSGANPLLLNVLLLSSASAFYFGGLGFVESGERKGGAGPLR
jgi:hypothetical protein